jgi:hypothetical protein
MTAAAAAIGSRSFRLQLAMFIRQNVLEVEFLEIA